MKVKTVPIKGMHCRSCEIMITDNLEKLPRVEKAEVSLDKKTATIYSKRPVTDEQVAHAVSAAGYEVGTETVPWISRDKKVYRDVAIAAMFVGLLGLVISRSGLVDFNIGNPIGQGVFIALLVGLTAGLSTCMALVGGLVLGMSARHASLHPNASGMERFRPHLFFNASRIIAFFVLGGLMGLVGSFFQLSGVLLGILMILVGIFMFLLGLQLTNLFPRLSTGGLTLPSGLSRALGLQKTTDAEYSHRNAVVLGAVSFFLPCGFTQAMQLYAMSTGSIMTGALVMGLFAIGTAPGLLGVGGLASVVKGGFAQKFFKFAGVAVMVLAFINISNGYTLTGWKNQLSNMGSSIGSFVTNIGNSEEDLSDAVVLNTTFRNEPSSLNQALLGNIAPNTFEVKAGKKHAIVVDSKDNGVGCMSTIMIPGLVNKPILLKEGEKHILQFTANAPGTYPITCAMGLPFGELTVV